MTATPHVLTPIVDRPEQRVWIASALAAVLLALPMGGLVFALHHWSTEPVLALGTGANVNEV